MGKGATVKVRDANGNIRHVTPKAVSLVRPGFYKILEGEEFVKEQPKKKEVVETAEAESDHKEVTFDDDFGHVGDDVDEIESLRKEYMNLSGKKKVDKRFKEDKLKQEIEKLK
jgi:hypothetical protein